MKIISEISEKDVMKNHYSCKNYNLRKAARAVLFDKQDKIALLFVSKDGYHKLPGGGVESGEDLSKALQREVDEEVGCKISIGRDIGVIIEYRNQHKILQISYCFVAKVVGKIGTPSFTKEEIEDGFEIKWASLSEALKILKKDRPKNYSGKFIVKRDIEFLEEAARIVK